MVRSRKKTAKEVSLYDPIGTDKEGNEILVPDTSSVLVLGKTGDGSRTVAHEQKRKVEDDQTSDVPPIFAEWKKREGLSW